MAKVEAKKPQVQVLSPHSNCYSAMAAPSTAPAPYLVDTDRVGGERAEAAEAQLDASSSLADFFLSA
jgi:hypothetical protein